MVKKLKKKPEEVIETNVIPEEIKEEQLVENIEDNYPEGSYNSNEEDVPSSVVLSRALKVMSKRFNVGDDYYIKSFKNGAKAIQVLVGNADYDVCITFKNSDEVMILQEVEGAENYI